MPPSAELDEEASPRIVLLDGWSFRGIPGTYLRGTLRRTGVGNGLARPRHLRSSWTGTSNPLDGAWRSDDSSVLPVCGGRSEEDGHTDRQALTPNHRAVNPCLAVPLADHRFEQFRRAEPRSPGRS